MFGGVYAIITDDKGRILLQLRNKYRFPDGNRWTILSGKIKLWESAETAVERELREELGITVNNVTFFLRTWRFFYVPSYIFHVKLNLKEPVKIYEGQAAKYVSKKEMQRLKISSYSKKILKEWYRSN